MTWYVIFSLPTCHLHCLLPGAIIDIDNTDVLEHLFSVENATEAQVLHTISAALLFNQFVIFFSMIRC